MLDESVQSKAKTKTYSVLLLVAVLLVAVNLRPAITSVGPLLGTIRDDIGFANWSIAFLTSLPLIAFMLVSSLAPKIANRLTNERSIVIALLLLAIGISLRSIPIIFYLFLGTVLIGCGIAICNVLLPSVIRDKFPYNLGIMTSLYTSFMAISATTASGLSVPLAEKIGLGWNLSLLVWCIPAVIALIVWSIIVIKNRPKNRDIATDKKQNEAHKSIWKDPLAWKITLFMGLQSLTFYVILSWLPEILQFYGMESATAGFMLSYFQLLGIPLSFIMPIVAFRMANQRPIVLFVNIIFLIGLIILLVNQSLIAILVATTCLGIAVNSNFALALTLLSIRAKNSRDVAELSGMAQSMGYCIAAVGPVLLGLLFDLTQEWKYSLFVLVAVVATLSYFGLQAGKNRYVFDQY